MSGSVHESLSKSIETLIEPLLASVFAYGPNQTAGKNAVKKLSITTMVNR
jgi:hypothetical protein